MRHYTRLRAVCNGHLLGFDRNSRSCALDLNGASPYPTRSCSYAAVSIVLERAGDLNIYDETIIAGAEMVVVDKVGPGTYAESARQIRRSFGRPFERRLGFCYLRICKLQAQ